MVLSNKLLYELIRKLISPKGDETTQEGVEKHPHAQLAPPHTVPVEEESPQVDQYNYSWSGNEHEIDQCKVKERHRVVSKPLMRLVELNEVHKNDAYCLELLELVEELSS